MDVNIKFLKLIEAVSDAETKRYAQKELLHHLMEIFDLDQSALCELNNDTLKVEFALDRTKRIIPNGEGLWISEKLIREAIKDNTPKSYQDELSDDIHLTKSIHEYSLKNVLCIPLEKNSKNVIYLASQRKPNSKFSEFELKNALIASKAAALAFRQFNNIQSLKDQNNSLKKSLTGKKRGFLYSSDKIEKLMCEVERVAPFNISTFIYGESGTGKEELAREIHLKSKRKGPFIAVNCATLTETLLESELFGYVKGAFTGAVKDKKGLFQEANEGTLFLDEIAEIPINLQSKLLRAIQERSVRPLGANKSIPVDIRIISASLKNLENCVKSGEFREDLFYRVNEISFTIPPLKDRPLDIELLTKKFLNDFSLEFNLPKKTISDEAFLLLKNFSFPGNVRELKNICRSAIILSGSDIIGLSDIRLPRAIEKKSNINSINSQKAKIENSSIQKNQTTEEDSSKVYEELFQEVNLEGKTLKDIRKDYDKILINALMNKRNMTQEAVANELGVSVRTVQRLIQ